MTWPLTVLIVIGAAFVGWLARELVLRFRRSKASGSNGIPIADMLEAALGATPIGIGYADRDLRCVRVNQAFAQFNGIPPEAHVGRPVRELLPARAWEIGEPLLRRVLETGEPVLGVHVRLGEPGISEPVRDFYGNIFPVRGPWGRVVWVGATVLDVTARVRNEEERERLLAALRESEARFRALFESGVMGVLVANQDRVLPPVDRHHICLHMPAPVAADDLRYEWQGLLHAAPPDPLARQLLPSRLPNECAQPLLNKREHAVGLVTQFGLVWLQEPEIEPMEWVG